MSRKWLSVGLLVGCLGMAQGLWAQTFYNPGGPAPPPGPPPTGGMNGFGPFAQPLLPQEPPGAIPFAEMSPIRENAFSSDAPGGPFVTYYPRIQFGVDYLILWFRPHQFSAPLMTVGDVNDQIAGGVAGAISQPGTRVILGRQDVGSKANTAGRFSLVYWVADPQLVSLEANYWLMEQRSYFFARGGDGSDPTLVYARPFFDTETFSDSASQFVIPGLRSGTMVTTLMTRMMGTEVNVRWCQPSGANTTGLSFLGGVRFLRLDEKLLNDDLATDLPVGTGLTSSIHDNFTTYNQFVGGQFGVQLRLVWERLLFDVQTKLAIGPNYQTFSNTGYSIVQDDTRVTPTVTDNIGTYVQPFNFGTFKSNPITYVPEVAVNMGCYLTDFLKLSVGYNFFWVSNVARAGNQVNPLVNLQTPGAGITGTTTQPQPLLTQSDFWVQWLNLGLELVF